MVAVPNLQGYNKHYMDLNIRRTLPGLNCGGFMVRQKQPGLALLPIWRLSAEKVLGVWCITTRYTARERGHWMLFHPNGGKCWFLLRKKPIDSDSLSKRMFPMVM